jgi:transcriptional regulator with XRE-family HTH domain
MAFKEEFEALDARRRAARVSSEELGAEAGVSAETLSRWRNGHQSPNLASWEAVRLGLERAITKREEVLRGVRAI